jgi:hypothetical protein
VGKGKGVGGTVKAKKTKKVAPSSSSSAAAAAAAGDVSAHSVFVQLGKLTRALGKCIAKAFLASIAPKHVPMAEVLASDDIATAKAFITEARTTGKKPVKSYAELEAMVRSVGLEPLQVISFTEDKWNTPCPGNKAKPGGNRHQMAGQVLMYIIQHKQLACAGRCGKSFEDHTVEEMSDLHLDHRTGIVKGTKYKEPCDYNKEKPDEAVKEWAKCESTCARCHDQGEKSGGKKRAKTKTAKKETVKKS